MWWGRIALIKSNSKHISSAILCFQCFIINFSQKLPLKAQGINSPLTIFVHCRKNSQKTVIPCLPGLGWVIYCISNPQYLWMNSRCVLAPHGENFMLSDFLLFNSGNRNTLKQVSKLQHDLDTGTSGSSAPTPPCPQLPALGTLTASSWCFFLIFHHPPFNPFNPLPSNCFLLPYSLASPAFIPHLWRVLIWCLMDNLC